MGLQVKGRWIKRHVHSRYGDTYQRYISNV